jgi:hypothetical protein
VPRPARCGGSDIGVAHNHVTGCHGAPDRRLDRAAVDCEWAAWVELNERNAEWLFNEFANRVRAQQANRRSPANRIDCIRKIRR